LEKTDKSDLSRN